MQVGNTMQLVNRSISPLVTRKRKADVAVADSNFLSAVGDTQKTAAISLPTNTERPSQEENHPIECYQTMMGRAILNGTFFTPGSKSLWADEELVSMLSKGETIDTTKTVNWASLGEKKLTEEQITYLKKKYDVTNLSSQEYYDLLSELTHMDVLSAEDCIGANIVYTNEKPPAFRFIPYPYNQRSLHSKELYQTSGNLSESLSVALDILRERLELINSDQYMKVNMITEDDRKLDRAAMEKNIHTREILLNLMNQLR